MPSAAHELRRKASDVARILELTLEGKTAGQITRTTRYHHVQAIQYAHGYPDMDAVRNMWQQLRLLKDLEVWFEVDPPIPAREVMEAAR